MQDIDAMLGGVRPPEDGRKPEPQPKKLTEVERLKQQRDRQKAKAFLAYCEGADRHITHTVNGEKKSFQLYEYVVWLMGEDGRALP